MSLQAGANTHKGRHNNHDKTFHDKRKKAELRKCDKIMFELNTLDDSEHFFRSVVVYTK